MQLQELVWYLEAGADGAAGLEQKSEGKCPQPPPDSVPCHSGSSKLFAPLLLLNYSQPCHEGDLEYGFPSAEDRLKALFPGKRTCCSLSQETSNHPCSRPDVLTNFPWDLMMEHCSLAFTISPGLQPNWQIIYSILGRGVD